MEPLELELQAVVSSLELVVRTKLSKKEQYVLLTAEPSPQPQEAMHSSAFAKLRLNLSICLKLIP